MKTLIFIMMVGNLFGQDITLNKYDYFLGNTDNLNNLEAGLAKKIKSELIILHIKLIKELFEPNKTYEKKVFTGTYLDEDMYKLYVSQGAETWVAKEWATGNTVKMKTVTENIAFNFNKVVYKSNPEWQDVVNHYGGYSELLDLGISKDDWKNWKFDYKANIKSITLLDSVECVAKVKLKGNLEYHNIKTFNYDYKGNYKIESFSISDLYNNIVPALYFSFPQFKYMNKQDIEIPANQVISNYNNITEKYISVMKLIIDDMISVIVFRQLPEVKEISNKRFEQQQQQIRITEKFRERAIQGMDLSVPSGMFGFYYTYAKDFGFYYDMRTTLDWYNMEQTLVYTIGDTLIGVEIDYKHMFNIGIIKKISPSILLYAGSGISLGIDKYKYYDESDIGYFFSGYSKDINFIGGILIHISGKYFKQIKIGCNSTPLEISVGLGRDLKW